MKKRFEMKVLLSLLAFSLVSISPLFAKTGTFTDDGVLYTYEYTEDEEGDIESVSSFTAQGTSAVNGHVTLRGSYHGRTLGSWTFSGCTRLTSITLPSSLTSIPSGAFRGCSGLTEITIPENVTSIGDSAFKDCINIREMTFHCKTISLSPSAIQGVMGLERVVFTGESVTLGCNLYPRDVGFFQGRELLKTVVFPSKMTRLRLEGNYYYNAGTFSGCSLLEECKLPSDVDEFYMGEHCFDCCGSLRSIKLPSSLTRLPLLALAWCTSLTELELPKTLTVIGDRAIEGCRGLTNLTIPASVTSVGARAFEECSGLTEIVIPASVTSIGDSAFKDCINIREMTFHCKTISLSPSVIQGVMGLERVVFTGESVTLGCNLYPCDEGFFQGRELLKTVVFPSKMTRLRLEGNYYYIAGTFRGCSLLEECKLPSDVDEFYMGEHCFQGCMALKSIKLASTLKNINQCAFNGCTGLTEITIPENVTSIGDSAFKDCINIREMTFHCKTISLSPSVIQGVMGLERVVFTGESVTLGCNLYPRDVGFFQGRELLKTVVFPSKMTRLRLEGNYYYNAGTFSGCSLLEECKLPSDVDEFYMGEHCFDCCGSLRSIKLPSSLTRLPLLALAWCTSLTELELPKTLTVIGDRAIEGCRGLTNLTIPASVTSVGARAFEECSGLTEIVIPASVTSIGDSAFKNCTNLRDVTFHCKNISVDDTVFDGVMALKKLVFTGESVTLACGTSQGSGTFEGVKSLKTVVFPSSMKKLVLEGRYGAGTFRHCSALEECVLPNEVDEIVIGEYCFDCCSVLKSIALPSSVTELPRVSFAWCMSLTELKLPKALTVIGDRAIEGCRGLTNLTIPASVTSVGARAFEECSGLTEIVIPASVTSLGADAFKNCTALEYVKFLGAPPAGSGNVVSTLTIGYYLKKHEAAWAAVWDSQKRWRNLQMMLKAQPIVEIVDMDWTTGMATFSWGEDTAGNPVSGMFDLYCSDSTNSAGAEVVAQDVTVAGASVSCFTSQSSSSSGASLYSGSTRSNKGLRPRKYWVKPKGEETEGQYEKSEPEEVGKCYAFLVGMTSLGNAQTEILAWESLLTTIYDVEKKLTIGDIDKATLIGHLDALAGKAKAGDLVFYIHSGHGTLVNGEVALAVGANDSECFTTAELREALNAFNSGVGRVLMINSCYSGGMLCGGKNIAGMAACSANQLMKDSTFLSDCLLTAGIVNGGAIDSFEDGWISGAELFTFSKKWFENSPYGMTPKCLNNGMLANIVFAKEVGSTEDLAALKAKATLGDLKVLDTGTMINQLLNVEFKWKDPKNVNEIAKEIPTQNFVAQFTAGNQLETIPCRGVSNSVYEEFGEVLDKKRTTNGIEEEIFKDNATYSLCVYPKFKTGWGAPTNKVKFVKSVPTRFKDLTHALMARPFSVPTVKFSWSLDWAEEKEGIAVIKYIPETLKEFKISFQEGENLFSSSSYGLTEVIEDLQKGLFALSFEVTNFKTGLEYKAKVISKSSNADIVNGSASNIVTFKIDLPQTFTMTVAQVQEKNPNIALIASNGAINLPIMVYDHDGDGKTTYEECYAGTDPFNSSSHCNPMIVPRRKSTVILASVDRATSFAQSNETITLHWAGADARVYRVYGAESLDGEWTLLDTLEGVEGTMSLDVSQSSAHFFKMVITLAEEELTL